MNRKMKTAAVICLIIGLAAGTAEILGSRITEQPEGRGDLPVMRL